MKSKIALIGLVAFTIACIVWASKADYQYSSTSNWIEVPLLKPIAPLRFETNNQPWIEFANCRFVRMADCIVVCASEELWTAMTNRFPIETNSIFLLRK